MAKQAISIEALLVWAYQVQLVDQLDGRGVGLLPEERRADGQTVQRISPDGCAAVERIASVGCEIDGGQWNGLARSIPHDADQVHSLVTSFLPDRGIVPVVIHHARTGGRPDWLADARWRYEPVRWMMRDGQPMGEIAYVPAGERGGKLPVVWVTECDHPDRIAAARSVYGRWHNALVLLQGVLIGRRALLHDHECTAELPPVAPWLSESQLAAARMARQAPREGRFSAALALGA